jgi:hypothetical protein
MVRELLFYTLCCLSFIAPAQQKSINAVKTTHSPVIDGDLSDVAWQEAPVATDFMQYSPFYGAPV